MRLLGCLQLGLLELVFLGQRAEGGNPDHIAFLGHAELVHLQHQIQDLVPGRRLFKGEGDLSADIFVDRKIFTADFSQDAEDVADIGIKEIKGDFFPGVFFLCLGRQTLFKGLGFSGFFNRQLLSRLFPGRLRCRGFALFNLFCRIGRRRGQDFFPFRQTGIFVRLGRDGRGRKVDPQLGAVLFDAVGNRFAQLDGKQRIRLHFGSLDRRYPIHRAFKTGGDQGPLAIFGQAGIKQFELQPLGIRLFKIIFDRNRRADDQ